MGYVRKRPTYRLVFEDAEFAGLEVVVASASVEAYERIASLASREYGARPSADDATAFLGLLDAFAALLVSWNLETEAGAPVPATAAGLRQQDPPFALTIINAWMDAISGVPAPLPQPSDSGELVASLPMDVL